MNNGNSSNNSVSSENSNNSGNSISWGTKAKYVGVGIVIGTIISPLLRKGLSKIQPKVDELFDHLTGKTEEFAERTSDLLARAKSQLRGAENGHDHKGHEHAGNGTVMRD